MSKNIKVFGCDFDPNPDIDCLRRKIINFINSNGNVQYNGPYDIFKYYNKTMMYGYDFSGKMECPKWVSATPVFNCEIYPEMYRNYINKGNCRKVADAFGDMIAKETSDNCLSVAIGVDHCLTGGIYRALKRNWENIVLVVFDMHLDAITPYTRNRMVGYSVENHSGSNEHSIYEYYDDNFTGSYDTGSFLSYLEKDGVLGWDDLIVLGIQDAPDPRLRKIKDARVEGYLQEYDALVKNGAAIHSLDDIMCYDFKKRNSYLHNRLRGKKVYLSIDIDVFEGKIGMSARYGSSIGLGAVKVAELLSWLGLSEAEVIGMDIMEADVNTFDTGNQTEKELAILMNTLIKMVEHSYIAAKNSNE